MSSEFNATRVGQYVMDTYRGKIVVWCSNHEWSIDNVRDAANNSLFKVDYQTFHNVLNEPGDGELVDMLIPKPLDIGSEEVVELIEQYRNMIVTGDDSEDSYDDCIDVITSTDKLVLLSFL